MNLDSYISELLQEAAEKQLNLDPAAVALCLKNWNAELQSGAVQGVAAQELTQEQVENAIRNFLTHISHNNQLKFGFIMPGVYTFAYQCLIKEKNGQPNLFKRAGLTIDSSIINIRISPLEKILLTNPVVQKNLETALQNNEPKFVIGKFAKRDENGNVILKMNSKGKKVPAEEEDRYDFTRKGAIAQKQINEKMEILTPFIEAMKDVKNYSLSEMKFLLDQYNQDTIELQTNEITRRPDFQILEWTPELGKKSESEIAKGVNLVYTTEDGMTKVFAINNQADAIKAGYYQLSVRERMEKLIRAGIVDSDEYMGSQWCVTQARKNNSFYSSYRQFASTSDIKDYTFYLVVNNHLDFYDMTDEEIAEKPREWRKLSNLKFYINMFCIQPKNHPSYEESRVRISPLNNGGENKYEWSAVDKKFPGLEQGKEIFQTKKFEDDEMVGGAENVGYNEDSNSPRFIGAQPQSVKRTYIQGPYNQYRGGFFNPGTIGNPEVWRSLDALSKKAYFEAADKDNYLDMFKSSSLFNEIKSEPQVYSDMIYYLKEIHGIPDAMINIKKNILRATYDVNKPYRISEKNKNVMLLKKINGGGFNLIDIEKMEPYVKDGIDYDGDYQNNMGSSMLITTPDEKINYMAQRFDRIKGAEGEDSFWVCYRAGDVKMSFFITNRTFKEMKENGTIKKVEKNVNGKINVRDMMDNPEDLERMQDIDEIIKGLK